MNVTGAVVAMVSLAVVYTIVRCPQCRRRLMDVPGSPVIECRAIQDRPSGRGRTLVCHRCKTHTEVIEHG